MVQIGSTGIVHSANLQGAKQGVYSVLMRRTSIENVQTCFAFWLSFSRCKCLCLFIVTNICSPNERLMFVGDSSISQESWLHIRIVEAKNLCPPGGGVGTASPYCSMRVGSDGPIKQETKTIENTLNPVRRHIFSFSHLVAHSSICSCQCMSFFCNSVSPRVNRFLTSLLSPYALHYLRNALAHTPPQVWNESFTFMIRAIDFSRQFHIKVNHGGVCLGRCIVPLSPLMQRPQVRSIDEEAIR